MCAGLGFFGDGGGLASHRLHDGLRLRLGPQPVGPQLLVLRAISWCAPFRIKPFAGVLPCLCSKGGMHLPIVAADKLPDLFLALDHDRQGRRLYPAHRGEEKAAISRIERGHGARAIDADQPVGFRTAAGRIGQGHHLLVTAQLFKTFPDGRRGHRLQPEPFHRMSRLGILLNQPKYQLAFAAGVASVDQRPHILALGQLDDGIEPPLGLVDRLEVEIGWNHRQVGKAPLTALDVKFLRGLNFHQMAHCRGDDPAVVFEVFIVLFELAGGGRERPHNVLCHRRLFCDHQGLARHALSFV